MTRRPPLLLILMSLFLALFVALGIGFMIAASSEKVNRLLLTKVTEWVPEIEFDDISGSIAHTLAFDFQFQADGIKVAIENAHLKIKPSCFWNLTLCVDQLQAHRLDILLYSTDSPSTEPIELPELSTPLLLTVKSLELNRFHLAMDDSSIIDEQAVRFSARWINHHLQVSDFSARDAFCQWSIDASIRFTRQYPIEGDVQCDTTRYPFSSLYGDVKGDLDSLTANISSTGALTSKMAARISPLQPSLPLQFKIALSKPFLLNTVAGMEADQTQVLALTAEGEGNLDRINLQAQSRITSEWITQPVNMDLKASTSLQKLDIQSLVLNLAESTITSQGELDFADHLEWKGSSQISNLDFKSFQQTVAGDVSGTIEHLFQLKGEALSFGANLIGVSGSLNQQPWQAQGKLLWQDNKLTLQQLNIKQTENSLLVNGYWSPQQRSDFITQFDMNNLSYLLPDLTGQIDGNLSVKGTLEAPEVSGSLNGNGLAYEQLKIGLMRTQINWKTNDQSNNSLTANVTNLAYGEAFSANLQLELKGLLRQHSLRLSAQDREKNELELACDGQFGQNKNQLQLQNWQGRCNRLEFAAGEYLPGFNWSLEKPFQIAVKEARNVEVEPFCLYQNNQQERSTLCTMTPVQWQDGKLADMALKGRHLPLSWAQPWLPENALLTGNAELNVNARSILESLHIEADIESGDTRLRLQREKETDLDIRFSTLRAQARYSDKKIGLDWKVQSDITGTAQGRLDLNEDKMAGDIDFDAFRIGPFTRLALSNDSDQIEGEMNGKIEIGGTLQAPEIAGSITAENGHVRSMTLPLPVENIALTASFNQNKARINGRFDVAGKSGQVNGNLSWENDTWYSRMNISAETLVFKPQEDITVHLTPNISFEMKPGNLILSGDIHVPKARIYLRSLPEQAISSSSDAELVGAGIDNNPRLNISSHFKLSLGNDVRFEGFGLKTLLTGKMEINQKNNGLMRASGGIRLEKGEYQAYGQQLTITDGDLIFIDDIANPQLRFSAVRDKIEDNVVVGIRVTGRAKSPDITVFSIPDMPQQEKLHYLVTGRAPNTDKDGSSSVAAEAALSLALQKNSGFTKKAGEAVGIENLQLTAGSTENRSEVGLSGYITPDLMVRYGVGMFEAVNTISLSYRLRRNLYFEVISGKSNAVDLLWSFDRE